MEIAWFFIFGLLIGSFLNASVYRLKHKKSLVRGRSQCPHCQQVLLPWDLVPVFSFFYLRGKCRHCRQKISWQYPLVELLTGLIFALGFGIFGWTGQMLVFLVVGVLLIAIAVYDFLYLEIPDAYSLPAIFFALLGNWLIYQNWGWMLFSGLLVFFFFAFQFLISRGKWLGGGDLRLGFLMGVFLVNWQLALLALFIAYISGAVLGLILLLAGRKKWQSQLPFGPFLILGTFVASLFGQAIISWYLRFY